MTGNLVDMIKTGIVEPFKVTRSALQNAASIGALVLTTETLIADKTRNRRARRRRPSRRRHGRHGRRLRHDVGRKSPARRFYPVSRGSEHDRRSKIAWGAFLFCSTRWGAFGDSNPGDVASLETGSRVDVYLFYSFDLVESSRLKAQKFAQFNWVELFQHFHSFVPEADRQPRQWEHAVVWKYLGDEILLLPARRERAGGRTGPFAPSTCTLSALTQELNGEREILRRGRIHLVPGHRVAGALGAFYLARRHAAKMAQLMAQLEDLKPRARRPDDPRPRKPHRRFPRAGKPTPDSSSRPRRAPNASRSAPRSRISLTRFGSLRYSTRLSKRALKAAAALSGNFTRRSVSSKPQCWWAFWRVRRFRLRCRKRFPMKPSSRAHTSAACIRSRPTPA